MSPTKYVLVKVPVQVLYGNYWVWGNFEKHERTAQVLHVFRELFPNPVEYEHRWYFNLFVVQSFRRDLLSCDRGRTGC